MGLFIWDPIFEGIQKMMQMHDDFEGFPKNISALFGLVSYFMTPVQLNWKSQKSNPGTSRL